MTTVILTSAGTDSAVDLCRGLRSHFGNQVRLIGVDLRAAVPCVDVLDDFFQAPPRQHSDYVPFLVHLCQAFRATHVWPLSTEDQELLSAHREGAFVDRVLMSSRYSAVSLANDKICLSEYCRENGFPVATYCIIDSQETLEAGARTLGYPEKPVVLKLARGTGAQGLKILRAERSAWDMFLSRTNRDVTLELVADQLRATAPWPRCMLAEYLPGEEFSVDVLRYGGHWYGGVVRRRDDSFFGLATDATVVERNDILGLARRIVESIDLESVNNLQFRCAADGQPVLMEINPRVPGTIGLSIAAGCNLPALALELALGRQVSLPAPAFGTRILRFFGGTILRP